MNFIQKNIFTLTIGIVYVIIKQIKSTKVLWLLKGGHAR